MAARCFSISAGSPIPLMTILAPSLARARAMARPMPLVEPVTSALREARDTNNSLTILRKVARPEDDGPDVSQSCDYLYCVATNKASGTAAVGVRRCKRMLLVKARRPRKSVFRAAAPPLLVDTIDVQALPRRRPRSRGATISSPAPGVFRRRRGPRLGGARRREGSRLAAEAAECRDARGRPRLVAEGQRAL